MKPSLQKLQKFFKLEAERGYDNRAVMGGLDRMLESWEAEARSDNVPEELIQIIRARIRDYGRLSEKSRAESLQGIWRRVQRVEAGETGEVLPNLEPPQTPQPIRSIAHPEKPAKRQPEPTPTTSASAEASEKQPQPDQRPEKKTLSSKAATPSVEPSALNAPVTVLQGVGPRIAQSLGRLGLHTLRDMLYYFPRRYDDYSLLKPINRLVYGEDVTVIGVIKTIHTRTVRNGKMTLVEALITDGSGTLRVTWFNQVYIAKRLHADLQIVLSGKVDQYLGRLGMTNPEMETLDEEQLNTNRIVPVYPLTAQVTQRFLRNQMKQIVSYWAPRLHDPLPEEIRSSANLMDLPTALLQVHYPDNWEVLKAAQERISFDEILLLQLGVLRQKRAWQDRTATPFSTDITWMEAQIQRLPFALTAAQTQTLADIQSDLSSGRPMNRLIQGDVGSGKTVVAALAVAIVTSQGAQASLMAPTSLLAEQHYRNLLGLLASPKEEGDLELAQSVNILGETEIRLLVGATSEPEKREIREGLANGSIKLVIGTHALIEEPVQFANLQLTIVDEQHRFGVEQRAALRAKGDNPHLLVMTATPIPRSLALTVYGDLDLSVMDEMPPGRQPVSTHVLMPHERERAYALIRSQIEEKHQAFIVYPLIEENETSEALAAVEEQERLQKEIFYHLRVGLLHGRMKAEEKEEVMQAFRKGEFPILVSTTVIEVGVDIPNATVMLIEGANRFGLAQLHQLRGRVGRSAEKSYCLLIPDQPDEVENERLQVMESTNDGFILAERDLEQRGPGQFLGSRQSGFADLRMANLTDVHLIEKARRHAFALFDSDPELSKPEHQLLASSLQQSWDGSKGDIS